MVDEAASGIRGVRAVRSSSTAAAAAQHLSSTSARSDSLTLLLPTHRLTGNDNTTRHFWGAHQAFFKQLLNSLKAKFAIAEAQEAIDRGECVVIGLLSTGEAKANARFDRANANENGVVEEEVRTTPHPLPSPTQTTITTLSFPPLSLTPLHPSLHTTAY